MPVGPISPRAPLPPLSQPFRGNEEHLWRSAVRLLRGVMAAPHNSLIFDLIRHRTPVRSHSLPFRGSLHHSARVKRHTRPPLLARIRLRTRTPLAALTHAVSSARSSPLSCDPPPLQLGNLCPDDSEEAKALIPSLQMPDRDIDTGVLTDVLTSIASYRSLN